MTPDGRYVAFESTASDLVAGDSNGLSDVFLRDMQANTTTLVRLSKTGGSGNSLSYYPTITPRGQGRVPRLREQPDVRPIGGRRRQDLRPRPPRRHDHPGHGQPRRRRRFRRRPPERRRPLRLLQQRGGRPGPRVRGREWPGQDLLRPGLAAGPQQAGPPQPVRCGERRRRRELGQLQLPDLGRRPHRVLRWDPSPTCSPTIVTVRPTSSPSRRPATARSAGPCRVQWPGTGYLLGRRRPAARLRADAAGRPESLFGHDQHGRHRRGQRQGLRRIPAAPRPGNQRRRDRPRRRRPGEGRHDFVDREGPGERCRRG